MSGTGRRATGDQKPADAVDVVDVAERRVVLEDLQRGLKAAADDPRTKPYELAAISRELRAVAKELDALPPAVEGDAVDEISARRAKRLADADSAAVAGGAKRRRAGGDRPRT